VDGAIDAGAARQRAVGRVDDRRSAVMSPCAASSSGATGRAPYPEVVEPDEAGTSLSNDVVLVGAV
jgi:hypothetical protein